MRISVAQIVTAVAAGVPQQELLGDYPGLEPEDIQAALLYAANLVEAERVYPVLQTRSGRGGLFCLAEVIPCAKQLCWSPHRPASAC